MDKKLLKIVFDAIEDKKGTDIEIIDFDNQHSMYDYFVVVTCTNDKMAAAIVDNVEDKAMEAGYSVNGIEGKKTDWVLLDLGIVVVHVFTENTRLYYSIEELWSEMPRIDINEL